jgi:hypothetical protein
MENNQFAIEIDDVTYNVKLHSDLPRLYDILCGTAYHRIGKTDAGAWVYVEDPILINHMPLQQIGEAIEEYLEG